MSDPIRLAILGCGAITRECHLPAVIAHPRVSLTALVDVDIKRARELQQAHGLDCKIAADARSVLNECDAIIVALPNHLHAAITQEALRAGVHVLCEKPLATTIADARACCDAAVQGGILLAVGMNRRFHQNSRILKLVFEEGLLGDLQNYEWEHGAPWDWNSASGFYLDRSQCGGGVLVDFGVHMLDCVAAWFGTVTHLEYQDDDWGSGIEANAILNLRQTGPYGSVKGYLRMSRMYSLKNRLLVRGTNAQAEIHADDPDTVVLHRKVAGEGLDMTLRFAELLGQKENDSFYLQLDNFVQSIKGTQSPVADCQQALSILELVQRCYAQDRRIPEPWSEVSADTLLEVQP